MLSHNREIIMNGPQAILFNTFTLPKPEPVLSLRLVTEFFLNILTVFTYGAFQQSIEQGRVKKLESDQNELVKQINTLTLKLNEQENKLGTFLDKQGKGEVVEAGVQKLRTDISQLKSKIVILENNRNSPTSNVALATIAFFGQWIANILTLGTYSLYQNHALRNRFTLLTAENSHLIKEFGKVKKERCEFIDKTAQLIMDKGNKADEVNKKLEKIANVEEHQSEYEKLQVELGPIAPKYTRKPEDEGEIPGAMDLSSLDQSKLSADWINFAKAYKKQYDNEKRTAAEIIESSFESAFNELLKSTKLNKSMETGSTPGRFAIIREMAYRLIMGAKLTENGCHGFQLKINENVSMLPSQPEKVLQYKDDQKGGLKPVLIVHHKQRDDFTPSVEAIGQNGVDPVSAKWILNQLTPVEHGHLLNLLRSPVIENDNPSYKASLAYMSKESDPRVKLVRTAYELVVDIAVAFEKKFGQTVFPKCWGDHLDMDDYDLKPFVKPDDIEPDLSKIVDTDRAAQNEGPLVDWEFDPSVIGIANKNGKYEQADFLNLMLISKARYDSFFKCLDKCVIKHPAEKNKEFTEVTFNEVDQYFRSHEMLGQYQTPIYKVADVTYGGQMVGGHRCLFSNLLAIFVIDQKDLTDQNVFKLRKAMSAYLDKLQKAKQDWEKIKHLSNQPKDAQKIKESAELAAYFEKAILKTHKSNVPSYQSWLRGESASSSYWNSAEQKWIHPKGIDIDNLSRFEIELCAFTFGLKIDLVLISTPTNKLASAAKADENGLILSHERYGPNTREFKIMGISNETYSGLFPKLDPAKADPSGKSEDYQNLVALTKYWESVHKKKTE